MGLLLALLASSAVQGAPAQPQVTKVSTDNELVCRMRATPTGAVQKHCVTRKEYREQQLELQRQVQQTQLRSFQLNPH